MPEEIIGPESLYRTSKERLSRLYEIEQEYCAWDQARRELKHLPYLERMSIECTWPRPLRASEEERNSENLSWTKAQERIHEKLPYLVVPLEARAWAALEDFKYKKWKLHRDSKRRLRTPSSGRTQGLTFAIPEHLGRPPDHIFYKAWFDPHWKEPIRQEVPWIDKLTKYPRRRSTDESE